MDSGTFPPVTVFALGGTIAAVADGNGLNASMTLGGTDIVASVPALAQVAEVTAVTFRTTPSASLTLADLTSLAAAIEESVSAGASGIVVTQGTDTLEETAWMLDLLVETDRPIVVTGAMRNVGKPGADGPANLLGAVTTAASELAVGLGTLVHFNDEIHAARFVRKSHSSSPSTFQSPGVGPIGWINEGRVRIPLVPRTRTPRLRPRAGAGQRVGLYRIVLDDDGATLGTAGEVYDGLVVDALGGGHVPASLVAPLAQIARRIPVVFASRAGSGELYTSTGTFAGSEQELLAAGLISAAALDGLKARILLTLLLRAGKDRAEIAEAFATAVA
jgi:L-asparaginase